MLARVHAMPLRGVQDNLTAGIRGFLLLVIALMPSSCSPHADILRKGNVMTPADQQPVAASAGTGQGWNWFLRILGIVLAFGAGSAFWYALLAADTAGHHGTPPQGWLVGLVLLGLALWAALAAGLLRTWWAVLIVPVAFYAGMAVAAGGITVSLPLVLITIAIGGIGAVIGIYSGLAVEQRLHG